MRKRIVILGGGTGGVMVANRLVRALATQPALKSDVAITLLSDTPHHLYQPGFLYMALGLTEPSSLHRRESDLLLPGIRVNYAPAEHINLGEKYIDLQNGEREEFDYLVVATGSSPNLEAIPGFRQIAHSFYTYPEALRMRKALAEFQNGKLLVIIGVPHKCPVAPLEFLLMYEDLLRKQGRRDQIHLHYTYPIGRLHSLEPVADWMESVFEERGITSDTFCNPEVIDVENRVVQTLEGDEIDFDFLVGIPPHQGASVIRNSGLGDEDGWLPTDARTLQLKGFEGVYVLGDATDLPLSKAGSTAHYQASTVVQNLIHELNGEPPLACYDGKVFCFIESSSTEAAHITFDYHSPPAPASPSTTVHWFKLAFNQMYWASLRGLV